MSRRRPALVATTAGLLLAALLQPLPAAAQWKWRDARGQVHISDMPPPREVPERDVLQRPPAPVRSAPSAATAASAASAALPASGVPPLLDAKPRIDPELEARRRKAAQDEAAQRKTEEQQQAAQRAANCQRAQESLRQLDSGMRIARLNDKGEREVLDDQARAAEAQRARDAAAANCR